MKESISLLEINRSSYLEENWIYKRYYYNEFNYSILQNALVRKFNAWGNETYNDITIMIDTESSKKRIDQYEEILHKKKNGEIEKELKYLPFDNHIVLWTLSIRLFNLDIATLYGRKPSELMECIKLILDKLKAKNTFMYIHNLTWDYTYLRKFLFKAFNYPIEQLNVKSHYPIQIKFENGLILRDSLILFQRTLEKTAEDFKAPAQKQIGLWDYDKIRNQNTPIDENELTYAEFDTLAGSQCIDILKNQLHKHIGTMPYTATGILRDELKKLARENNAKKLFNKIVPDYETYLFLTSLFHGGYTHGNREYLESNLLKGKIQGYDFSSSYPFCLLCCTYPITKFVRLEKQIDIDYILRNMEDHAFIFTIRFHDIKLKDENFPMPILQFSKCKTVNDVTDNGRILACEFLECNTNELDLYLITKYYTWDEKHVLIKNVKTAKKGYLPDWFRKHIFKLYIDKTKLKNSDPIIYQVQKGKVNACFGLSCQKQDKLMYLELFEDEKVIKNGIEIEYKAGMYKLDESKPGKEVYYKNIKKRSVFLPYQWGCYTTSLALIHLFELGSCCKLWLYSDTDSVYGMGWNKKLINKLNRKYKKMCEKAGFSFVLQKDEDYNYMRKYWLGIAETSIDDKYNEFKYMGAKRYCGRSIADNELHLTVSGIPKSSVKCLEDNLINFKKDFVFKGELTNKKTHNYIFVDDIYIDENGNETADSIDLSPCDYKLDVVEYHSLEEYLLKEDHVEIPFYTDDGWVTTYD